MTAIVKLIWPDAESVSLAAAYYFTEICARSIARSGRFSVALSGGSTPRRLYEILASKKFRQNIDWEKVLIFWGDERMVPHTHNYSNFKMAKDVLLKKIKISEENIFPAPVAGTPRKCAAAYEQKIRDVLGRNPSFDLMLLGLGADGHTASLFPGDKILKEETKLVAASGTKIQPRRISFTYPLINRSWDVMFLVTGAAKAPVFQKICLEQQRKTPFPAQRVQPIRGGVIWLADQAAAGA